MARSEGGAPTPDWLVDAYLAERSLLGYFVVLVHLPPEQRDALADAVHQRWLVTGGDDLEAFAFADMSRRAGGPLEFVFQDDGPLFELLIEAHHRLESTHPDGACLSAVTMLGRASREAGASAWWRGGQLLRLVHEHDPRGQVLDEARDLTGRAVASLIDAGCSADELAAACSAAGGVELACFIAAGDDSSLDRAIDLFASAVEARPSQPAIAAGATANLVASLSRRFSRHGQVGDLDDAIAAATHALDVLRSTSDDARDDLARLEPGLANARALARMQRYGAGGEVGDLDAAEADAADAVALATALEPSRDADLAIYLDTLATLTWERYGRTRRVEDLDAAVALSRQSVDHSSSRSSGGSLSRINLASRLISLFDEVRAREHLDEAIALIEDLDDEVLPETHLPVTLNIWARGLSLRGELDRSPSDQDHAIDLYRRALSQTPAGHPNRAGHANSLALRLEDRFERAGAPSDRAELLALLRTWESECRAGRVDRHDVTVAGPSWVVKLAALADRDDDAELWLLAADIGAGVLEMASHLAVVADPAASVERRRAQAGPFRAALDGIAGLSALCRIRAGGRGRDALEVLESGLTTMAVEQAGRIRYERAGAEHAELVDGIVATSGRLDAARRRGADIESAREDVAQALAELEARVGRLDPHRSISELASMVAATGTPTVWLAATRHGGVQLVLEPDGATRHRLLPGLTYERVVDWHLRLHPPTDAEEDEVMVRGPDGTGMPSTAEVLAVLDEMDDAVGPGALIDGCWLVPAGLLATLPWQSRWPSTSLHASGAMHALSYASSNGPAPPTAVALLDPERRTPWAVREGPAIRRALTNTARSHATEVFEGREATTGAIHASGSLGILHISSHGTAEPSLKLADGPLRPADLLDRPETFAALRLLFPNCCMSGSLPVTYLDEAAGFATAATIVGAAASVVALWPVNDRLAADFAEHFYTAFGNGATPLEALDHARSAARSGGEDDRTPLAYQLFGH